MSIQTCTLQTLKTHAHFSLFIHHRWKYIQYSVSFLFKLAVVGVNGSEWQEMKDGALGILLGCTGIHSSRLRCFSQPKSVDIFHISP